MFKLHSASFGGVLALFVLSAGLVPGLGIPAAAAHTAAPAPSPAGPTVKIDNFTFSPAALTVAVGTTVTWVNRDDIPHMVVADDKSFRSKVLDTDEHYSFTFTKPGVYGYFCSLHPHMIGKVIVSAN